MSNTLLEPKHKSTIPVASYKETQLKTATRYKLTTKDVYALIEKGQLAEDQWFELINGDLYIMPLPGHKHIFHVDRLNHLLSKIFVSYDKAIVRVQSPIAIGDSHLPVPDITLLSFTEDLYEKQEAQPKDILLVIEVSHTTLYHDRERKIPIYAEAGIPEVWIVNVPQKLVHVYREVTKGKYEQQFNIGKGESLAPLAFPEDELIPYR